MNPKAASTCETCETWPELVLKLVGICVKLVKLVKLGRNKSDYVSSKFHEFHEFHANTNEFEDELWPSFTSFACLREGRRLQTLAGCTCVWAEVQGKSLQSLRAQTKRVEKKEELNKQVEGEKKGARLATALSPTTTKIIEVCTGHNACWLPGVKKCIEMWKSALAKLWEKRLTNHVPSATSRFFLLRHLRVPVPFPYGRVH